MVFRSFDQILLVRRLLQKRGDFVEGFHLHELAKRVFVEQVAPHSLDARVCVRVTQIHFFFHFLFVFFAVLLALLFSFVPPARLACVCALSPCRPNRCSNAFCLSFSSFSSSKASKVLLI